MRRKARSKRREARPEAAAAAPVPPPAAGAQPDAQPARRRPRVRLSEEIQEWIFERLADAVLLGQPLRRALRNAWTERFESELPEWVYSYYALRPETLARREAAFAALLKTKADVSDFEPARLIMQLDAVCSRALEPRIVQLIPSRQMLDGQLREVLVPIEGIDGATAVAALREKGLLLERLGILKKGLPEPRTE